MASWKQELGGRWRLWEPRGGAYIMLLDVKGSPYQFRTLFGRENGCFAGLAWLVKETVSYSENDRRVHFGRTEEGSMKARWVFLVHVDSVPWVLFSEACAIGLRCLGTRGVSAWCHSHGSPGDRKIWASFCCACMPLDCVMGRLETVGCSLSNLLGDPGFMSGISSGISFGSGPKFGSEYPGWPGVSSNRGFVHAEGPVCFVVCI